MMKKIIIALQLSWILVSINAFSQTSENALIGKFLIEGGYEYGGDEVLNGFTTNHGDDLLKAGQGAYLAVGGQLELSKVKYLMLRASIGIKYHRKAVVDDNTRLTKIPVRLIPYLKIKNNFRLGIGVTMDAKVKLKKDGNVSYAGYLSSIGPRFELGYKWLAISYTSINYLAETDGIYSASSFGLSTSFTFPKNKKKT